MRQPATFKEKSNIDRWRRTRAYATNQGCCCCLQIFAGMITLALLGVAIALPIIISLKSSSTDTELTSTTSTAITMNISSGTALTSTTTIARITSNSIWTNATTAPTSASMTSMTSVLMSTMSSSCFGPMLLTFDDIINASNIQGVMPFLYNCFNWVNGWYLNVSVTAATSGYRRSLTSGDYIILNRNGTLMNMTTTTSSFDILSFVGSSGYASPLHLSLQGLRSAGVVAYTRDVLVYNNTGTIISLNWSNLTTVTFGSYYYNPNSFQNYTGLGYQFSLDNLNVTLN